MTAAINRHAPGQPSEALRQPAQTIAEHVHPRDDAALADHTPTVDGTHVNTTDPHVSDPELETPEDLAPSTLREAIGHAVENNRAHHSAYPPPRAGYTSTPRT